MLGILSYHRASKQAAGSVPKSSSQKMRAVHVCARELGCRQIDAGPYMQGGVPILPRGEEEYRGIASYAHCERRRTAEKHAKLLKLRIATFAKDRRPILTGAGHHRKLSRRGRFRGRGCLGRQPP